MGSEKIINRKIETPADSLGGEGFVGRKTELQRFKYQLNQIQKLGSIHQTLWEIRGSPGAGKSALIRQAERICQEQNIPVAVIDFDPQENPNASRYQENPCLLIEDLMTHLPSSDEAGAVTKEIAAFRENGPLGSWGRISGAFQEYLRIVIQKPGGGSQPVVLMFDSTEMAGQETKNWLEEWLVNPMAQNKAVLLIWGNRARQRWERFETRRRSRSTRLSGLSEPESLELFGRQCLLPESSEREKGRELYQSLQPLTLGHPGLNLTMINILNKKRGNIGHEELTRAVKAAYIDGVVLEGVKDPNIRKAIEVLSALRLFDNILAREVLIATEDIFFTSLGRRDSFGFWNDLKYGAGHLLVWDDGRRGYTIDPMFRRLIGAWFMLENPKVFLAVQETATRAFDNWIEKAGDNAPVYITEKLYHLYLTLGLQKEQPDMAGAAQEAIAKMPEGDKTNPTLILQRLISRLEEDSELLGLVGEEEFQRLLYSVKRIRAEHL